MRGASEVVLPKWSTEEPETSRLRHARCVAVVEQERVSVRVGEGLLYAEPGSKSEQAVAMLAATIGEPKRGAVTRPSGSACTGSRRAGLIEDAHDGCRGRFRLSD
jgi:hypothetical protein